MDQLSAALREVPDRSTPLSLTSSFGGAYSLVRKRDDLRVSHGLSRDRHGHSTPARMALYTTELLASGLELRSLPQTLQSEILYLVCLVLELTEDELLTKQHHDNTARLWREHDDRVNFVSMARRTITDIVSSTDNMADGQIIGGSLVGDLISIMLDHAKGLWSLAFYSAKALSSILESMVEAHGLPSGIDDTLTQLEILKAKPETVFSAVAFLNGIGEMLASSKAVKLFCNRLISDVAGATPGDQSTLLTTILLNACLSVYGSAELPVESRRQIFAVRQITSWLETLNERGDDLAAEACKALNRLFPNVSSVYGPYWEQAIEFCISVWNGAGSRGRGFEPCLHASLKLYATLETLKGENDDLNDALAAHAEAKSLALLHLLTTRMEDSEWNSDIVDALLCRQIEKVSLDHVKDLSDLYGLVASESREIQTAAFGILSKAIAAAQAQISVDVLLEKRGKSPKSEHQT